jgi:hypothetical protein
MRDSKLYCQFEGSKVEVVLADGENVSKIASDPVRVVLATGQTIEVKFNQLSGQLTPSNGDLIGKNHPRLDLLLN